MLYQIDNLNADENDLFEALETYVDKNGETCVPLLQPAIKTIRFRALERCLITNSVLITEKHKYILFANKENGLSTSLNEPRTFT